jgi:ketosteroid isomerase-like protein
LFCLAGIASAGKIDDVRANVYAWGMSWQSQDINSYISFYSPVFRSKGLDYQGWQQRKTKHFRKINDIRLEISDLWVFIEGRHATAKFVLRYQDSKYSDVGEKTLTIAKEGDKPRIVIDIKNVSSWSGHYRTPVNGNLIKQIRTYLHRDTEKLRIVLDINSSENYSINHYQTEYIYCIEVR